MKLDSSQQAVLDACVRPCALSVIGAAGSGKTTVLRAAVAKLLEEEPDARIAVLSPDRRAATDLRNSISLEAGALGEGFVAQSITAFAFSIVSAYSQAVGRGAPELISGPDQDVILKEIFDLAAEGVIPGIFPDEAGDEVGGERYKEMAKLPAFRAEFRDLITRAAELGLSADELKELGVEHGRERWVTGARVMADYEESIALAAADEQGGVDRVDHARLITQAAAMLRNWGEGTGESVGGKFDVERPRWDWVLVDDVQNATLALGELLRELQADGASIVTFGDPDLAVQGYRGGVARLPALLTRDRNDQGIGAQRLYLDHRYRGAELESEVRRITDAIHTAGAGRHRGADFVAVEGEQGAKLHHVALGARAVAFKSAEEETGWIATHLRRLHLVEGVPYSQMAVVTRSQSDHHMIRNTLIRLGVPVAHVSSAEPLREQAAVSSLIEIISVALDDPHAVSNERLEAMLTGRLFGIDPLALRAMKRELHGWELAAGGTRLKNELLRDVLAETKSHGIAQIPELGRAHRVLVKIREATRSDALAEGVLWAAWDALGVAETWQMAALGTGPEADTANRNLDAIIQLFRVAQRLADQNPRNATIGVLLEHLVQQDLPEDTIARTGSSSDEVTLTTPSATIGRSWDHVVAAGLNEGVWPNTRLRNPLTDVPALVSTVVGSLVGTPDLSHEAARRDVIDDELRMLLQTVTRADASVVFTCVNAEGVLPSRFLEYLGKGGLELDETQHGQATLDEDGLVGQLRQGERLGSPELAGVAASMLDDLAHAGVASANRKTWVDSFDISGTGEAGSTYLSPSRVETILKCPMRAFLQDVDAQDSDDRQAADLGTLVHALAEQFPDGDQDAIWAEFERLWPGLEIEENYEGAITRLRAEKMINFLIEYLQGSTNDAEIEVRAVGEVDGVRVSAKMDRLERDAAHPQKATVVDFKTGTKGSSTKIDENAQLMIYQWLVERGHVEVPSGATPVTSSLGARMVVLGTTNKSLKIEPQEELGQSGLDAAEGLIREAAESQRGPNFAATVNDGCRHCAYKAICPVQDGKRVFS